MANKELTALPAAGALTGTSVLYMVDENNNSRKVTLSDLAQYIKTAASIVPASNPWRGARIRRTANLSIATGTNTIVSWQTADTDTNTFWSAGAPTRLTVPAGVTKVELRANVRWNNNSTVGTRQFTVLKNGLTFPGRFAEQVGPASGFIELNGVSADIPVAQGDYFEIQVFQSSGVAVDVIAEDRTWFQIKVVEGS